MYKWKFQTYPLTESTATHTLIPHLVGMYCIQLSLPLNPIILSSTDIFIAGMYEVLNDEIIKLRKGQILYNLS